MEKLNTTTNTVHLSALNHVSNVFTSAVVLEIGLETNFKRSLSCLVCLISANKPLHVLHTLIQKSMYGCEVNTEACEAPC